MRGAGLPLVALSNGSRRSTEELLERAGVRACFESVVTIEDVGHWKPHRETYLHAARVAGVAPASAILVSAHSWDVNGAKQAGLLAAWVERSEKAPNPIMAAPDVRARSLHDVADALLALTVHA